MNAMVSKFTSGLTPSAHRAGETGSRSPKPQPVSPGAIDQAKGLIASPDQIEAWFALAQSGDRFVYATRSYLPAGSTGAQRMRTLSDQGLVHLIQKRSDLFIGEWCYLAERSSKSEATVRPPARPKSDVRSTSDDVTAINALLPVLKRAARFGRPCPTDLQLAEKAGIDRAQVQPALDAMRTMNIIRVSPAKAPTLRFITIVESGHKTGLVACR